MLTNLEYIDEHKTCTNYYPESHTNFTLLTTKINERLTLDETEYNHLVFILKGRLLIEHDDFAKGEFGEGEIVFFPAYSKSTIISLDNSQVLKSTFEFTSEVCSSKFMESYWRLSSQMEYVFTSVPIKAQMKQFLDLMITYLRNGINCAHLHEIKQTELFLVLRWFYTKEEYVRLLHPIIGKSIDFRAAVVKNYPQAKNVEDLASIIGMSRSTFDTKFKETFGMPAKQWMLKRVARSIRYYITKPDVTISEIMEKYNFDSFPHFNRFCKQQFGVTPSELVKMSREQQGSNS